MEENKWLIKAIKLLKDIEDEYGIIFINDYFCNIKGDNYENYVFVMDLLDNKKELGKVLDIISITTKEDFNRLKENVDKIHQYNFEISESEFRHRLKATGFEYQDIDDKNRPMTVFEVKVDEYNSIRLCELCDKRIKYEKYKGDERYKGKTTFSFSANMAYEITFLNNMYQLKIGHDIYGKQKMIKEDIEINLKEKALDNLFNEIKPEIELKKESMNENEEDEEIVINLNKKDFIKDNHTKIENVPFEDYLMIKIVKHMYGDNWKSEIALSRISEDTFLQEFKQNNPDEFNDIFKTMLIECIGYVKNLE